MYGATIVESALEKIGQEYEFGAKVPLNNAGWNGPWDCAEYCTWAVYQVSEIVYGCLDNNAGPENADAWTGSWKRNAETLGEVVPVEHARFIPGAMILRRNKQYGHIVISTGSGNQTLEARGSAYGVVEYVILGRRWDMGILVPGIEYVRASVEKFSGLNVPLKTPTVLFLKDPLMRSEKVYGIKQKLKAAGYYFGEIDDVYDELAAAAVHRMQLDNGLTPDGEFGPVFAERIGVEWQ